ncbi:cell death abnormality protein 1-like [Ruditapes philippinarum]|uniref:cell death abnormality protein 1-like n=1 Tax=Ruditapes philippinarum TaxID=129788 RepID=UPI00295C3660|nr:cell death abnormality protein 1-like [Ruditapes philippinarum]
MRLLFPTVVLGIVFIHCTKAALTTGCNADTDCEQNSSCGDDTNCACNSGFKLNANEDGCVEKVLEDVCDETNGCPALSNTECTGGKCMCKNGYAEKNSLCTKTVSGTTCTANGNECDHILNSHCGAGKCQCNDGFVMNVDVCAADTSGKVIDTGCTKDAAVQCTHTENAECDNAETGAKCKCSDGFAEDRTNGKSCVKTVSGTTCTTAGTECDAIANSHCDASKCKCNDGFVMNADVCAAENAATSVQFGILTIYLSVLALARQLF